MISDLLKNVVIYAISEPGAMGNPGVMEFVTDKGEYMDVNFLDGLITYEELKEAFPALQGCYWNGPTKEEITSGMGEIVVYPEGFENGRFTQVSAGWQHVYLGFGNHLVLRQDCAERFLLLALDEEAIRKEFPSYVEDSEQDREDARRTYLFEHWTETAAKMFVKKELIDEEKMDA